MTSFNETSSTGHFLDFSNGGGGSPETPENTTVPTIRNTYNDTTNIYCSSEEWKHFTSTYRSIHGELSILVCIFGSIANLLNLTVLTRKSMISPTNAILTGLALADLLNMVEYIPYATFMYIRKAEYTYGFALFILVHSNFSQICHTVSIWLTLTLAVWRYIAVGVPTRSVALCTMDRAKWAIASAYIFSPILSIPVYLGFQIRKFNTSDRIIYVADLSDLALANDHLLEKVNFWIYSVVIKLIPCIALTIASFRLINALMDAKKRKQKLLSKRSVPLSTSTTSTPTTSGHHDKEADRTTRMLLAVLLLFLITEFPQGILGLLSGVLGNKFFKTCYVGLGELMDFVALLNSAINFILYCVMSKKFRETFKQVFGLQKFSECYAKSYRRSRTGRRNSQYNNPQNLKSRRLSTVPITTTLGGNNHDSDTGDGGSQEEKSFNQFSLHPSSIMSNSNTSLPGHPALAQSKLSSSIGSGNSLLMKNCTITATAL